jgi:hypothetical protein
MMWQKSAGGFSDMGTLDILVVDDNREEPFSVERLAQHAESLRIAPSRLRHGACNSGSGELEYLSIKTAQCADPARAARGAAYPVKPSLQKRVTKKRAAQRVATRLRAVSDELGVTTPKAVRRSSAGVKKAPRLKPRQVR